MLRLRNRPTFLRLKHRPAVPNVEANSTIDSHSLAKEYPGSVPRWTLNWKRPPPAVHPFLEVLAELLAADVLHERDKPRLNLRSQL